MTRTVALPRGPALLALAGAGNLLVAVAFLRRGTETGLLIALIPGLVFVLGALIARDRIVLLCAALGLGISLPVLNVPFRIAGKPVYAADVVVLLALGAWIGAKLLRPRETGEFRLHRPAALGWPFAIFGFTVMAGVVKGHLRFGGTLFGQPLRLLFYAGIACALSTLSARQLYRALVAVFYVGTLWMFVNAIYYLATGQSQTGSFGLSTGGTRVLALTVAMYISGALFLALLNLQYHTSFRARALDMLIVMLATFEIVIAYGRTTFVADTLVLLVFAVFFTRIRNALLAMAPLLVPILVLTAIFVPRFAPTVAPQFVKRVTAAPSTDVNVRWREKASEAIWRQARESPITGVGFGGQTSFSLVNTSTFPPELLRFDVSQDAHDSYLWLVVGGGVFCLGGFLLVVLVSVRDALRRLRDATEQERLVITWALATLFLFLVHPLTGPVLSDPRLLLTIWTLLLIPSVVPRRSVERSIVA